MPDTNDELDPIECSESTSDSGADSDSDSDSGDENEENMLIHNLHYQDPEALVRAFRRNHRGVVGTTFNTVLDFAARNDIRSFIRYIASAEFRRAFLKAFRKHKWKILFLSLGILLMCNPVAIAGFGALGPVAGSFAAAWQSSIGLVVAGSPFAILQAIGMTWFIGIPVLGAVITSLTVAWWVWEDKLRDMWKICAGQLQNRFREWGGQLRSWWSWLSGQGGRPEENGQVHLD